MSGDLSDLFQEVYNRAGGLLSSVLRARLQAGAGINQQEISVPLAGRENAALTANCK